MTIDSLIQVVAIVIAVYALVPRAKQLEIKVRFGGLWLVVSIVYVITTTILLYYQQFQELFNFLPPWPDQWVFLPKDIAFFTTIYLVGGLWFVYQRTKIRRKDVVRFQELVEELLRLEEYPELISLLDQNWKGLIRIYKLRFPISRMRKQIRKYIAPIALRRDIAGFDWSYDELSIKDILFVRVEKRNKKTPKSLSYYFDITFFYLIYWFTLLLPDYSKYSEVVDEIFQIALTNESFIATISKNRPYFAFKVLDEKLPQTENFLKFYFSNLIRNPQSILYYEIQNMENISYKKEEAIRKTHRLLYFLFHTADKANELNVWKPVGDELIQILEERKHLDKDEYNLPSRDDENELARSPIFVVIHFFEIMVLSALYQGIKWHMWLYYFPGFVEKLLDNIKMDLSIDMSAEFPTRYHSLLYETFYILEKWIQEGVEFVELGQPNVLLESKDDQHENENILKSSIIALSQCVNYLLNSDKVDEKFKQSVMNSVFRIYFELRRKTSTYDYAFVFKETLKNAHSYSSGNSRLWKQVLVYYHGYDKTSHLMKSRKDVEEFEK